MQVKIRILSVIWKLIIAVMVGLAVIEQFGGLYPHVYSLDDLDKLAYLTIFLNVLVAVYFLIDALWILIRRRKDDKKHEWCLGFKHALLISIISIGIIANGLLPIVPFIQPIALEQSSMVLMLYSPLMVVLDWLIFEKKGQMHVLSPLAWLALPALYFGLIFAGVRYSYIHLPYAPLDIQSLGTNQVGLALINIGVVFLTLGFIVFVIDSLLAAIGGTERKTRHHHPRRHRSSFRRRRRHPSKSNSSSQNTNQAANETQNLDTQDDTAYGRDHYDETFSGKRNV